MKLKHFEQLTAYTFKLTFENGEIKQTDLKDLIGSHVSLEELDTARLNTDWGCLEFNNGMADIEPKTLYAYASACDCKQAA